MASLVSFARFSNSGYSSEKVVISFAQKAPTNSETGDQGEDLYPLYMPRFEQKVRECYSCAQQQ